MEVQQREMENYGVGKNVPVVLSTSIKVIGLLNWSRA